MAALRIGAGSAWWGIGSSLPAAMPNRPASITSASKLWRRQLGLWRIISYSPRGHPIELKSPKQHTHAGQGEYKREDAPGSALGHPTQAHRGA